MADGAGDGAAGARGVGLRSDPDAVRQRDVVTGTKADLGASSGDSTHEEPVGRSAVFLVFGISPGEFLAISQYS